MTKTLLLLLLLDSGVGPLLAVLIKPLFEELASLICDFAVEKMGVEAEELEDDTESDILGKSSVELEIGLGDAGPDSTP